MSWTVAYIFSVLQIKTECRQFASSFVGVMPLLELKKLEIHSFPQFSPTCFDILNWKFAHDFGWLYFRSNSIVVNLVSNFVRVLPLLELRLLEIHSFLHFSQTCFGMLSWIFAYDFHLMNFRSSDCHYLGSSLKELCPLWMYNFAHFSSACFEIELKFLIGLCFLTHHSISKAVKILLYLI